MDINGEKNMKKLIVTASVFVTIMLMIPATALPSFQKLENKTIYSNGIVEKSEDVKVIITLHTTNGKERLMRCLPKETIEMIRSNLEDVDLVEILPDDIKTSVEQMMDEEKEKLSTMSIGDFSSRNLIISILCKRYGLDETMPFSELATTSDYNNTHINALCTVQGFGILLLFPPFIPITPILYAGLLILHTNGTMGEWSSGVEHAFMMPFIGLSIWISGLYMFVGVSGLVIAFEGND